MISPDYDLFYFETDREEFLSSHFHNQIELVFPLTAGSGLVVDLKNTYPLEPGYLYILNEHTIHNRISMMEHYERYNMYFSPQLLDVYSTNLIDFRNSLKDRFYVFNVREDMESFRNLFENLLKCKSTMQQDDITPTIYFLALLKKIYDLLEHENMASAKALNPKVIQIQQIQEYIDSHLTEELNLDRIASSFYLSRYHLGHLFKQMTNYSVMQYVTFCRVAKACQLLQEGHSPRTVNEAVGVQSQSHFRRIFQSHTNVTPKQYFEKYASVQYQIKNEEETP